MTLSSTAALVAAPIVDTDAVARVAFDMLPPDNEEYEFGKRSLHCDLVRGLQAFLGHMHPDNGLADPTYEEAIEVARHAAGGGFRAFAVEELLRVAESRVRRAETRVTGALE